MARKERYLVGLDVGTSKVTAVVGEVLDSEGTVGERSAMSLEVEVVEGESIDECRAQRVELRGGAEGAVEEEEVGHSAESGGFSSAGRVPNVGSE